MVALPDQTDQKTDCPTCSGEGAVTCPACEGSGEISVPCPDCSGEQPTPPDGEDPEPGEDEVFDFGAWWTERTEPEKWILGIAGGLLVLAILKGLIR